jgi:hypothetical protein
MSTDIRADWTETTAEARRERRLERLYGARISGDPADREIPKLAGPDPGSDSRQGNDRKEGDMVFIRLGKLFGFSSELAPAPTYAGLVFSGDPATVTSTASRGGSTFVLEADAEMDPNTLTIDDLPELYAGDQIFVRTEIRGKVKRWIVGFLIRVATFTRRDKRPTVVNHVATVTRPVREFEAALASMSLGKRDAATRAMLVGEYDVDRWGSIVDYVIAEALGKGGFQYRRLLKIYGDTRNHSIAIVRHKRATQVHRSKIIAACGSLIGRKYGFLKVGAHGVDYLLTTLWNALGARGDVYLCRRLVPGKRYPMS